jgi:hypothetical protein
MSHIKTDYTKQLTVECKMSSREYYDFRLQALNNKVHFLVKWEQTYCIVTCEAPFLAKCGYNEGVDF